MKKLYFLFLMTISIPAISQPSVKIFAYSRKEMPGMVPKAITDENGKRINTQKESPIQYYIFAAYNSSVKINLGEIWISGKFYNTQIKNIDSTPVISINEVIPANPIKEILVPATKLKVRSIVPAETKNSSLSHASWFIKMTKHAELIVSYIYQGKKYFIAVKKIKVLEPVAGL